VFFGGVVEKNIEDYIYWLTLGRNARFTASLFLEVFALDAPINNLFELPDSKLRALKLSKRCLKEFIFSKENYKPENVLHELKQNNIEPVFIFENDYPELLKQIYDPPFILYKKGTAKLNQLCIGVVGSRRPSDYGLRVTEKITSELAMGGVTVVSGLAIGIDTAAHKGALSGGGQTIAVIGCGLNQIYPSSNFRLSREIIGNGAIISEYPFDTPPLKQNFPARNRIISGISQGLIVTEAAESSGSLITALSALNQNREVFAVPGNIFSLASIGTNNLIKSGAHVLTSVQDVYDEFGFSCPEVVSEMRQAVGSNKTEKTIIEVLRLEPKHIDEISKKAGLSQSEISSAITIMEISGKIKHIGGMVYRIN